MTVLSLDPVSSALYDILNLDDTLSALATGGVHTNIPQDPTYPILWIEVVETDQWGGMGSMPNGSSLPELEVRFHAYSERQGMSACQAIIRRAISLVTPTPDNPSVPLVITGYNGCGIFYDQTLPFPEEELNGVEVVELVARFRLYVESSS